MHNGMYHFCLASVLGPDSWKFYNELQMKFNGLLTLSFTNIGI